MSRYALYGRVLWSSHSAHGAVGDVVRVGLRTWPDKRAARAAKHRAIDGQEPTAPVRLRYFVARVDAGAEAG